MLAGIAEPKGQECVIPVPLFYHNQEEKTRRILKNVDDNRADEI